MSLCQITWTLNTRLLQKVTETGYIMVEWLQYFSKNKHVWEVMAADES